MSDTPFRGAFPHQHHDPRGLVERIQAQVRERIEEAIEMAGLKLLVDLRARHGRPAPDSSSEADRREFEAIAVELLAHVRTAFHAELNDEGRRELLRAEAGYPSERERLLAGHVFLARRLPDYWQRVEQFQAAYGMALLEAPSSKIGWRRHFFG